MTKRFKAMKLALGLTNFLWQCKRADATTYGIQLFTYHDTSGTYRYRSLAEIAVHRQRIVRSVLCSTTY